MKKVQRIQDVLFVLVSTTLAHNLKLKIKDLNFLVYVWLYLLIFLLHLKIRWVYFFFFNILNMAWSTKKSVSVSINPRQTLFSFKWIIINLQSCMSYVAYYDCCYASVLVNYLYNNCFAVYLFTWACFLCMKVQLIS